VSYYLKSRPPHFHDCDGREHRCTCLYPQAKRCAFCSQLVEHGVPIPDGITDGDQVGVSSWMVKGLPSLMSWWQAAGLTE
jgi:hypothetical protein